MPEDGLEVHAAVEHDEHGVIGRLPRETPSLHPRLESLGQLEGKVVVGVSPG